MFVRNAIANFRNASPRQFGIFQDRFMVRSYDFEDLDRAADTLDKLNFSVEKLRTEPLATIKPRDTLETIVDELRIRERGLLRERVRKKISEIREVAQSDPIYSLADFGPENLGIEIPGIPIEKAHCERRSLENMVEKIGAKKAWETTKGENAVVAVFDTSFCKDIVSREVDSWHDDTVESAYSDPGEGHGSMTMGAASANVDDGLPMNGVAPEAGQIPVRITDKDGNITTENIAKAFDWISTKADELGKPIVLNHSYGTPLCSGRPRWGFCNDNLSYIIKRVENKENIISVRAAGNEADMCGRRISGLTNGITGYSSLPTSITAAALHWSGRDAQRYSSCGRGDCAPVSDPKPNVGCLLPTYTYYGTKKGENGKCYEIKDMSMGVDGSGAGTSHATPSIAGVVALMVSANPDLQTVDVKRILGKTAKIGHPDWITMFWKFTRGTPWNARVGHGQVRADEAVKEAAGGV